MTEFKRTLTPIDIKILGDNPEQRLHAIIDAALKRMSKVRNPHSVETRILSMMSTTPLNARDIMEAHNAVYGNNAITLMYTRFVIHGMFQAGTIQRVSRGRYVPFDRAAQLASVNNDIMQIEMTGRTTGRERDRYQALLARQRELTTPANSV